MASRGGFAKAAAEKVRAQKIDDRARDILRGSADKLAQRLLDVALARGDFEVLEDARLRMRALELALSYGLGRPQAKNQDVVDEDEPQTGVSFG